jgi:hypothetical protein
MTTRSQSFECADVSIEALVDGRSEPLVVMIASLGHSAHDFDALSRRVVAGELSPSLMTDAATCVLVQVILALSNEKARNDQETPDESAAQIVQPNDARRRRGSKGLDLHRIRRAERYVRRKR